MIQKKSTAYVFSNRIPLFWNIVRGTALCGGSDKGVLFISVKDAVMHFRQDDQKQNLSFVFAGWKNPFTTELCF